MHVVPGWVVWAFYVVPVVLGLCLLLRYWNRSVPIRKVAPVIAEPPPRKINMKVEIDRIQQKAGSGSCRAALFELSALMRTYLDSVNGGVSIAEMTAHEIAALFGSDERSGFFLDLLDPLYGEKEPAAATVKAMCGRARKVVSGGAKRKAA
jgi:hypothetical protein